MNTVTRAQLAEAIYANVGLSRNESAALLETVLAAHERDMSVIALCARDAGAMGGVMRETDVQVCVPHDRAARVREVHALILHCLCDGVDTQLLGEQEML